MSKNKTDADLLGKQKDVAEKEEEIRKLKNEMKRLSDERDYINQKNLEYEKLLDNLTKNISDTNAFTSSQVDSEFNSNIQSVDINTTLGSVIEPIQTVSSSTVSSSPSSSSSSPISSFTQPTSSDNTLSEFNTQVKNEEESGEDSEDDDDEDDDDDDDDEDDEDDDDVNENKKDSAITKLLEEEIKKLESRIIEIGRELSTIPYTPSSAELQKKEELEKERKLLLGQVSDFRKRIGIK
jgi:hypothetical protein